VTDVKATWQRRHNPIDNNTLVLSIQKCKFFYIADGFKLDVLLDICQKSHSADYQGIRGPREVGEEKVNDIEINLVIDGSVVVDFYSLTL
jgi:hypothetical protein